MAKQKKTKQKKKHKQAYTPSQAIAPEGGHSVVLGFPTTSDENHLLTMVATDMTSGYHGGFGMRNHAGDGPKMKIAGEQKNRYG